MERSQQGKPAYYGKSCRNILQTFEIPTQLEGEALVQAQHFKELNLTRLELLPASFGLLPEPLSLSNPRPAPDLEQPPYQMALDQTWAQVRAEMGLVAKPGEDLPEYGTEQIKAVKEEVFRHLQAAGFSSLMERYGIQA